MRFLKFLAAFMLAFVLVSPASAMTGNSNEPAHYLALGDSLAAGMIQDGTIGKGYSDNLAEWLQQDELLASYNKGFAVPGAQTTHLLDAMEVNLEMKSTATGEPVKIVDEIKKADVITLSIGANDVLSSVNFKADGTIDYNLATVSAAITKMGGNVAEILAQIKKENPTADVFVMGLYNPKPQLTSYTNVLNLLVSQVDNAIKKATEAAGYFFIPVKDVVKPEFIPNPLNIHPNEAGYKAIAEQFYGPVKEYIGLVPLPEIIDDPLPKFKDITTVETAEFAGKAAKYGIMKGYEDGTFKPNGNLTRMQATSMLVRTLGLTETKAVPYSDTKKLSTEAQDELAKAYAAGIIDNTAKFKPTQNISRLEVAKMINAAYTYKMGSPYQVDQLAPFTDIKKLTNEQKQNVTLLYDLEISTGSNGKFMPTTTIKRSQAAKMFVVLKEKLEQK